MGKAIKISAITLAFIILAYFSFVRGGGMGGIFNYITSASLNSIYLNQKKTLNLRSLDGIYFPSISGLINKIEVRIMNKQINRRRNLSQRGFYLNNKYNLTNAIYRFMLVTKISAVLVSYSIAVLVSALMSLSKRGVAIFYLEILLLYSLIMMFTTWGFPRYKFFFILLIFLIIDFLSRLVGRRKYIVDSPTLLVGKLLTRE